MGDRDKSDSASEKTRNIGGEAKNNSDLLASQETVAATPADGVVERAATAPADPPDQTDRILAERYRLIERLGVGGFGAVYAAEDTRLLKRVAVKVLGSDVVHSEDMIARFRGEAIAASQIGHENIVDVTDFNRDTDGSWFIVMELLDGDDLADIIAEEGALSPSRALAICAQVAFALDAAHAKDIIHRDLKPANIYVVDRESREDFVKVIDFGISKIMSHTVEAGGLTSQGVVLGTPAYMAPEQASGERDIDGRVDVYALGVILYQALTGVQPFRGDTYLKILSAQLKESAPLPSEQRIELAAVPDIDPLVMKALAKDPDERYPTMRAFGSAILDVLEEVDATSASAIRPVRMRTGRVRTARSKARTVASTPQPGTPETLAHSNGEVSTRHEAAPAGRRSPLVWIGALVAVAAAAALAFVVLSGGGGDDAASSEPGQPTAAVTTPPDPAPVAALPPDAAPAPAPVAPIDAAPPRMIEIASRIKGASLYDGDQRVGPLPATVPAPAEGQTKTYIVKARRYLDAGVTIAHDSKPIVKVKLTRAPGRPTGGGGSDHDDSISREW